MSELETLTAELAQKITQRILDDDQEDGRMERLETNTHSLLRIVSVWEIILRYKNKN